VGGEDVLRKLPVEVIAVCVGFAAEWAGQLAAGEVPFASQTEGGLGEGLGTLLAVGEPLADGLDALPAGKLGSSVGGCQVWLDLLSPEGPQLSLPAKLLGARSEAIISRPAGSRGAIGLRPSGPMLDAKAAARHRAAQKVRGRSLGDRGRGAIEAVEQAGATGVASVRGSNAAVDRTAEPPQADTIIYARRGAQVAETFGKGATRHPRSK
jgi:hypothetical protein